MLLCPAAEEAQVVHAGDELEALPDSSCGVLGAGRNNAGNDVVALAGIQNFIDRGDDFRYVHRMISRRSRP